MKKLLSILFLFVFSLLNAQERKVYEYQRLRFGVEAGFENIFGSNVKPDAIRESQSYYRYGSYHDYYYDCGFLYNEQVFMRYYFGVKSEYSLNHRFAVAAGLRFGFGGNSLTSDRDNFLWRVSNTETSSNYLRIKNITQNVYNIGIPLEFKIFTSKSDVIVRHYFKIGTVFNFALAQDVSVDFADKEMNKYLSEIKNQFERPNNFNGQFVLGMGLKIGRMSNPFGSIEMQVPVQYGNNTRLNSLFKTENQAGIGIQANIIIPAGKQKLNYTYR